MRSCKARSGRRAGKPCGHVVVDGAVDGEKIRKRFPDADSRRGRMLDIEGIVECFAFLYRQHHKAWSFEVDVRTSVENW